MRRHVKGRTDSSHMEAKASLIKQSLMDGCSAKQLGSKLGSPLSGGRPSWMAEVSILKEHLSTDVGSRHSCLHKWINHLTLMKAVLRDSVDYFINPKRKKATLFRWLLHLISVWKWPTLTWGDPTLPSARLRFTSEFGMGSGGTTMLWFPDKFSGADTQNRTGDLILTKDALYRLSHISTKLLNNYASYSKMRLVILLTP